MIKTAAIGNYKCGVLQNQDTKRRERTVMISMEKARKLQCTGNVASSNTSIEIHEKKHNVKQQIKRTSSFMRSIERIGILTTKTVENEMKMYTALNPRNNNCCYEAMDCNDVHQFPLVSCLARRN